MFICLDSPRFSTSNGEDAHEFFLDYQERLHSLRSLESHGVAYSTYHLIDLDR